MINIMNNHIKSKIYELVKYKFTVRSCVINENLEISDSANVSYL